MYTCQEETPLEEAKRLGEELGNTILLKREDLQAVHSFEVRGAFNRMSQMTKEQMKNGVICASAGNHAQGVTLAALMLVSIHVHVTCTALCMYGQNWHLFIYTQGIPTDIFRPIPELLSGTAAI